MCDFGCTHFFKFKEGKYLYNKDTSKLHIKDYCQYTKYGLDLFEEFDTEAESLTFDARAEECVKYANKSEKSTTMK